jgi:PAS domain S-box-containing protein
MDQAPPINSVEESQRLEDLNSINILDSGAEPRFEVITQTVASVFHVPYCVIGFIDVNRVWYKSRYGLPFKQTPRTNSFEDYVVNAKNHLFTDSAKTDSRFINNYLVVNEPHINFCLSMPLFSPRNYVVAIISIMSPQKIVISSAQLQLFKNFSVWAQSEINKNYNTQLVDTSTEVTKARQELNIHRIELAEARARQASMLENIGDGVIGVNDGGLIVFINHAAAEMLGYQDAELLGKQYMHTIKMIDEKGHEVDIQNRPIRNAIFNKQKITDIDNCYIRKDGLKLPVSLTASPVMIERTIIGGVVVFRDITKEKEVDRMKTEFISLASHQLRTPLSAMKWFSELLLEGDVGELQPEQKDIVNNIYQSNERMIDLVNSLLNISRIESGRIIIDPKPTDLRQLVEEVKTEIDKRLLDKNIKLIINTHQQLPKINIDPKLIRHVYMNLLTNSIKYTRKNGEIIVMISKKDDQVISQVSDNGYGIPKPQQDKIFQKFFRADNIVKIETDGTGLGLYLTKAIVESSGGKIWFRSQENKGTTFWFSLPLAGSKPKKGEVVIGS